MKYQNQVQGSLKNIEIYNKQIALNEQECQILNAQVQRCTWSEESKIRTSISASRDQITYLTNSIEKIKREHPSHVEKEREAQAKCQKLQADLASSTSSSISTVTGSDSADSQTHTIPQAPDSSQDFKKSTLYIMKLAGMTKERNRLEECLRVMKDNITTRYANARADVEASLMSKRHRHTSIVKSFHGTCDSGMDQWRAKTLGRSSYGLRPDLLSMWPGNRIISREASSISSAVTTTSSRAGVTAQYKKLWTSSGHLLHPAYTAVIDRSGRFAITGSDDYLYVFIILKCMHDITHVMRCDVTHCFVLSLTLSLSHSLLLLFHFT